MTDDELDAMEAELCRDLEAAIVDLWLLQRRATHQPPVDLPLSALWHDQVRQIGKILGKPDDTWDIPELP
jgi:hypothetical protein